MRRTAAPRNSRLVKNFGYTLLANVDEVIE
jgi:hypothetical protein